MLEQSAASPLGCFLHREFGLTPTAVHVDLRGNILSVHLAHALAPMAHVVAHEYAGAEIVQGVYDVLLADCRERFGQMAAGIMGVPIRHIRIVVDAPNENVTIEFLLQRKEA